MPLLSVCPPRAGVQHVQQLDRYPLSPAQGHPHASRGEEPAERQRVSSTTTTKAGASTLGTEVPTAGYIADRILSSLKGDTNQAEPNIQ